MGAVAVIGANVSAPLPHSTLDLLHKSRLQGPTLEQLRIQVAELREQTVALKREKGVLAARFALNEQQGSDVLRRVGALEVSVPQLLEAVPDSVLIDRSNVTAAIGREPAMVYEAEGGTVVVRQRPMAEASPPQATQPLPEPPTEVAALVPPDQTPHGVAIGPAVSAAEALATWQDLSLKLGPVLFGLSPVLAGEGERQRIVVGPVAELGEASALCQRLERVAITCTPQPYAGAPLAVE